MTQRSIPIGRLLLAIAPAIALPCGALAATVANPLCPDNTALFDPDSAKDVVVSPGFTVSVFKAGLNFPTGIAFRGDKRNFEVYVLESGHGLPSACNEQSQFGSGDFDPNNPFTPDVLVFDANGKLLRKLESRPQPEAFSRRGPRSTLRSSADCMADRSSPPIRTRRCTRRGRTTARAS